MIRNVNNVLLIALFFFNFLSSAAQSDYRQGYIIKNNNDTIFGYIDYRADISNSKKCYFVKELGGEVNEYMPGEIFGYRFEDSKYYITKTIELNKEKRTIFIEFLLKGIVDLYYYVDEKGDHYFIDNKKGEFVELTSSDQILYKQEFGRTGYMTTTYLSKTNKHRGILRYLFADQKSLQNKIDKMDLNRNSLIQISKDYHNLSCKDYSCIVYEKPVTNPKIHVAILYTGNYTQFKMHKPSGASFPRVLNHSVGVLFSIKNKGEHTRFNFDIEARIGIREFYGSYNPGTVYKFDIKQSYINSAYLIKYTYPKRAVRPIVYGGLTIGYIFNNDLETEYLKDVPSNFRQKLVYNVFTGYVVGAGVQFKLIKKQTFVNFQYALNYSKLDGFQIAKQGDSYGIRIGMFIN